jgi:hypothetical protein
METEKEIDGNMQFLSAAWWEDEKKPPAIKFRRGPRIMLYFLVGMRFKISIRWFQNFSTEGMCMRSSGE